MILGGNTFIPQGGAQTFTLDRDNLGAVAATKGDGYFKDPDFWREVIITFQKSGMGPHAQRKALSFTTNDVAQMAFSAKAVAGTWELREIVITDKDRGILVLERADVPSVELYDLTITAV